MHYYVNLLVKGFYLFVTLEVTAFICSISMAMPCMFKPSYHAESMQVFFYSIYMDNSWNTLSISVLSQVSFTNFIFFPND